ncbi:MAG: DUF5312 family protein [Treponema sp.]
MAKELGFFQKLFSSLFSGNDPEISKKRLLKSIAKSLSKSKFHFYKASSHEAEPSMAKFFYEIYKVISPAQTMFQTTTANSMKNVVLDSMLTDKQRAVLEEMTDANIETMAQSTPIKEIEEKMNKNLDYVVSIFDSGLAEKIDKVYTQLTAFKNFCTFDFYFLLKKFDSRMKERYFGTPPNFQSIIGSYVVDDLKNFIDVAWALPFNDDWSNMFQLLKSIKGTDLVNISAWKKTLNRVSLLKENHTLEMMIQLITEDPTYTQNVNAVSEHIVDNYISQLEKQIKDSVKKVKDQQTSSKVDNLLLQVFGDEHVPSLKNYNETASSQFENKNLGSYIYAAPLSYLKSFLIEYVKKDLRTLSDLILIRGKWVAPELSSQMSNAYNDLLVVSNNISSFDDSMAEDVDTGLKLKTHLPRAERDREASNIIHTILNDVNKNAKNMILSSQKDLIIYAKNLKALLEDYVKQPKNDLIINWKELEKYADNNLKNTMISIYKKIYYFVSLLQNFILEKEEDNQ